MKTIIIAEAGVNHNGNIELAKKLVDVAVEAGADFVKFQTFKAENLVTKTASKAKYQIENTGTEETQFSMLKKLELSDDDHATLIDYCAQKKIHFLSTPFDIKAAEFLNDKVEMWKIPSGELTNFPFIKFLALKKKPIILSTGMATLEEVRETVEFIYSYWKEVGVVPAQRKTILGLNIPMLTVLHCVTAYPAPLNQVNLNAMTTMGKDLNVEVGYSDHTSGIEISLASAALGAKIIEKHFTLDKNMDGPDHKASLEPEELKAMIRSIRNIEVSLGDGIKRPTEVERVNIDVARKSLYYSAQLKKGHTILESDIIVMRPGSGVSPKQFDSLIGKKLVKDVDMEQAITLHDFENN